MSLIRWACVCGILVWAGAVVATEAKDDLTSRLIPQPRTVKLQDGRLKWSGKIVIVTEPDNASDLLAANTLVDACRLRGLTVPAIVQSQCLTTGTADIVILAGDPVRLPPLTRIMRAEKFSMPTEIGDQGYLLLVEPKRVIVAANDSAGVYYGIQTLIQMLPDSDGGEIPAARIVDWTDVKLRGIGLDLYCGQVYKQEWFKETIRRMAHYKMNCLVFYLEDAFQFPSHPEIGEDRDQITSADVSELDAFARRHHVELIPCYDSPGHMQRTLSHPKYSYLQEGDNEQQKAVINVTHPDAYPLLKDLYSDLCKAFSTQYIYVSGDEAFAIGTGKSRAAADELGKANLFVRHLKRIRDVIATYGKRMAVAADPFEPDFFKAFGLTNYGVEPMAQLPRDVIIGPWHYGKLDEFPFGKTVADMGFDQFMWTSWAAYYELFPNLKGAAENIEGVLPWVHRFKMLGTVHSEWNGYGENTFTEFAWPAQAYAAEWQWTCPGRPWKDALPLACESYYGPGTGDIAKTIFFLGDANRYFPWGAKFLTSPAFPLFWAPMEAKHLDADGLKLLAEFRRDLTAAQDALDTGSRSVKRNREHLDYLQFSLDQHRVLGDLIEYRHLMGQTDEASVKRRAELLAGLHTSFPKLCSTYELLWQRTNRPKGLESNRQRLAKIQNAIDQQTGK